MSTQRTTRRSRAVTLKWLPTLFLAVAAGCGGGGGDDTSPPAGTPAPAPAPAPGVTVTDGGAIDATTHLGTATFPSGSTTSGGQGSAVGTMDCGPAVQTVAYFTHLSIYQNGTLIQLPDRAGIVRDSAGNLTCVYPVHTHTGDFSGRIHKEGPDNTNYTLGQFFAVWGMPLSATNVAGMAGPVTTYVVDNGVASLVSGDPGAIELKSHRHIVLVQGTAITQIPVYTWAGN
jgi:hypothetical protein